MILETPTSTSGSGDKADGPRPLVLSAILVIADARTTHLIGVPDVIELLVALLGNRPYQAHAQEIRTKLAHDGSSGLVLSATNGSISTIAKMSQERWAELVMGLVTQTATNLTRLGAPQLAAPLLAALGMHTDPRDQARP